MNKYHKILNVYIRNPETKYKTLKEGYYSKEEFKYLENCLWRCTEKIDGTNIRVLWNGRKLEFRGRTDRAQIPKPLLNKLNHHFTEERMFKTFGLSEVCLYGEGYGHKIQSGKGYLSDSHDFILFDVYLNSRFLSYDSIVGIAESMQIDHVPVYGYMTLEEAIKVTKEGFTSEISQDKNLIAEGLILKPMFDLYDDKGARIIAKLKYKDFK